MKQTEEDKIATEVLDIAFIVHRKFGPGLFESVYEEIMCYELTKANIPFTRQQGIPVYHDDLKMEVGFRADIIVKNKVIIEIKSIEAIAKIHSRQVQTYLKILDMRLGVIINFNVDMLRQGIKRVAN